MRAIETVSVKETLHTYKKELCKELDEILNYWIDNTIDNIHGGFYGAVSNENVPDINAPKGIVLNSRILWAFSAATKFSTNISYTKTATRAFNYIQKHFLDQNYGGVYWSVDKDGLLLDGRKQIYGLAFCLYGLSEYYKVTGHATVLDLAKKIMAAIEQHSYDTINGGYTEAFTKEWNATDDLRLSEKDDNEKKTANTHLHIIEAYANLYLVWPELFLREKINNLLQIFDNYFINRKNNHLNLFLSEEWAVKSSVQSFGHDIEASWLLYECATITGNEKYINRYREIAVQLADAAAEAIDTDGGIWYEYDPAVQHWIREKHSWPQAEAMVGFFNAWQLTGNEKYFRLSCNSWQFVKNHICDKNNGEWFWGVHEDYSIMQKDKAGFWKCPYHNSRACMEVIKRISMLTIK